MTIENEINGLNADLEIKLGYHLQYNHYPPIDLVFMPVCKEAIDRVNANEADAEITMPNGVTLTAGKIVSELHLELWIENEEDY